MFKVNYVVIELTATSVRWQKLQLQLGTLSRMTLLLTQKKNFGYFFDFPRNFYLLKVNNRKNTTCGQYEQS